MISKRKSFLLIVILLLSITVIIQNVSFANSTKEGIIKADLQQEGVRATEITTSSDNEIKVKTEVVKLSKGVPDFPDYIHKINDEIRYQKKNGLKANKLTISMYDQNGELIFEGTNHNIESKADTTNDFTSTALDTKLIIQNLRANLPIENTKEVKLSHGIKTPGNTLNITLVFNDINSANNYIGRDLPSFLTLIEEENRKGAQIHNYKIVIKDNAGQMLLNLVANLDYRHFSWWQDPLIIEGWMQSGPKPISEK